LTTCNVSSKYSSNATLVYVIDNDDVALDNIEDGDGGGDGGGGGGANVATFKDDDVTVEPMIIVRIILLVLLVLSLFDAADAKPTINIKAHMFIYFDNISRCSTSLSSTTSAVDIRSKQVQGVNISLVFCGFGAGLYATTGIMVRTYPASRKRQVVSFSFSPRHCHGWRARRIRRLAHLGRSDLMAGRVGLGSLFLSFEKRTLSIMHRWQLKDPKLVSVTRERKDPNSGLEVLFRDEDVNYLLSPVTTIVDLKNKNSQPIFFFHASK
jgi:hypothetical protein